jgi:uncharacterized protein YbjT (DUF2867 family)
MRVVVFGASGATGRQLVAQAVTQGQHVTAFVRREPPLEMRSQDVTIVRGDVRDLDAVECAVEGKDAALCALGAATPLRRDPTLLEGVRHIVDVMEQSSVRRLVPLSFLGVREGRRQLSMVGRFLVAPLLLRNVVADHEAKNGTSGRAPSTGSSCGRRG